MSQAFYRFLIHGDIKIQDFLSSHIKLNSRRVDKVSWVLAGQATAEADRAGYPPIKGLEPLDIRPVKGCTSTAC
jgi:hypothetical protein